MGPLGGVPVVDEVAGSHEVVVVHRALSERVEYLLLVGEPLLNFQGVMTGVPQFLEDRTRKDAKGETVLP